MSSGRLPLCNVADLGASLRSLPSSVDAISCIEDHEFSQYPGENNEPVGEAVTKDLGAQPPNALEAFVPDLFDEDVREGCADGKGDAALEVVNDEVAELGTGGVEERRLSSDWKPSSMDINRLFRGRRLAEGLPPGCCVVMAIAHGALRQVQSSEATPQNIYRFCGENCCQNRAEEAAAIVGN